MRLLGVALAAMLGLAAVPAYAAMDAQELVDRTAHGDMFEVQSSRMALHLAKDDAVRDLARKMIVEHTEAMVALKQVVNAQGLGFPEGLDPERKERLFALKDLGERFTPRYLAAIADDHRELAKLLSRYAAEGGNAALKDFARGALPSVKAHLAEIEALLAR